MEFGNALGLYALLGLIPLIILYLIKPKPQNRTIPSLMFLIKENQKANRFSFLRKFIQNLLFFIQLLIIIGLVLALAAPYANSPYDVASEHTIIILDVSGSMQTKSDGKTRFENAIDEAKKVLSRENTIILAENAPLVILEQEDNELALDILAKLSPKATSANLGDAMIIARGILEGKTGRVVVISDFATVEGPDLLAVEKTMTSKEINVDFIDVSKKSKNIGITGLEIDKHKTKVSVKNYNDVEEEVKIRLVQDKKFIADSKLKISPTSVESVEFDTLSGISSLEIEGGGDELELDNFAYISNPIKKKINVLLITSAKKTTLETAILSSSDIELKVVNPPVLTITVNSEKIEPYSNDVIIVHQVNTDDILPGTFEDMRRYIEKGGNLILTAQEDLDKLNTNNLNPVDVKGVAKEPVGICVDMVNEFTKQFDRDRCFAVLSKHLQGDVVKDAVKIASAGSDAGIAMASFKKGKVIYYGIIDKESDFNTLPSYPVFWNEIINFLAKTEKIQDYNLRTGKIIAISKQDVKTPSGTITTDKLILDEQGIYEFDNKNFALNMIDAKESDVVGESSMFKKAENSQSPQTEQKEKRLYLDNFALILVFLLLALEMFYIKIRGDL